jgi:hypothetical protein
MPKSLLIVNEFINSLDKCLPLRLAYNCFNRSLFFLAVIEDNDHHTEKSIILTEARLNAKYSEQGYSISTSIVGKSDNVEIPEYFNEVIPDLQKN